MSARGQAPVAEQPPASYAGRTRFTQLEYEAVLANASIGVAFTRDRKFFLCNPRFADMFGYGPEELIGMPGESVYPSRESYEALGAIAVPALSAGKQLDLEWEMRRKDGSTFLARMIAKAISDTDTRQGTVWILEDITERRRQADEVNRLLREQDAILDSASIGIVFMRERHVVRCNRRYEEMYGYAPGELTGRPTTALYVSSEDYERMGSSYQDSFRRGAPFSQVGLRKRKDGTVFWVRTTGRAIDPNDARKGSVWTNEEITEQKRAEEELQRVLGDLQALLNNVLVGMAFVRERRIVRCNRRHEEIFGYAPGELLNGSTRLLYFTDEEYRRGDVSAELDAGKPHSREQWLRRKDGSGFWCRLAGRAVEPGDPAKGYVWLIEDITERKRADQALERLLNEQNALLDSAMMGISFVKDRRIVRCNRRFEEVFGYAQGELLNRSTRVMFEGDASFAEGAAAYEKVWRGETFQTEARLLRKDGTPIWCFVSGRAVQAGDPSQGSVWTYDDVSEDKRSAEAIERLLAEQAMILDNATIGIMFVRNRVIQRCNRRLEEMVGRGPGELDGQSSALLFASQDDWKRGGEVAYAETPPKGTRQTEWLFKRKDGSTFFARSIGRRIDPGRGDQEWIWIVEDITAERAARTSLEASRDALERAVAERTAELEAVNARLEGEIAERKQAEGRAQHLADHDALTGLPNRRLLEDRLTQSLALSYRNRKQTAVMFIDLDRFKNINDSLGHAIGDALLKEVAERLVKQLRDGDTICRIGGDEFVVVLPEVKRSSDAAHVSQKIIETLSTPITIDERDLIVTPSIGISVFPDDGRDAETLIRNADAAMYHAKEMGRANYQFFTDQMNLTASKRLALEHDLRRAVQKGEMRLYYQPITELKGGFVVGHEALLRWQHPTRGLVAPADFIQLAEDTGLILKLGDWVLREACRWATFIGVERGLQVAVNLSARQFNDPRLADLVMRVLKETGLPPAQLELEITESTAMQHTDVTLVTLKKLKEIGVSLAIDDFGTGYSSLDYLRRFPVDKLKIDQSFLAGVPRLKDNKTIVAAMIALAHALGLKVVAEGVETEAQLEFLQTYHCDCIQGYLAGKPADADTAAKEYV